MLEGAVEERRLGQHRDGRRAARLVLRAQWPPDRSRSHSTPFDGDRRLHSAITFARRPASGRDSAAVEPIAARLRQTPRGVRVPPVDSRSRRTLGDAPRARRRSPRAGRARPSCRPPPPASSAPSSRASARAAPESMLVAASAMPSAIEVQRPATKSAAPALNSTTSRAGPFPPARTRVDDSRVGGRIAALQILAVRPSPPRRRPDADRTCAPSRRGIPRPSCSRSSRSRRCRPRRGRPTRARIRVAAARARAARSAPRAARRRSAASHRPDWSAGRAG